MALTNRGLVRAEISALFDSISELQQNLAYPPTALNGESPILTMRGDGTTPEMVSANHNQFDHFFIATILVNQAAHGVEGSEDLLDTIYTAVMQKIRDNITGTNFQELVADASQSQAGFLETIDGIPYRYEEVSMFARSNPNG